VTGREVDAADSCVLTARDRQQRCLRRVPFWFTRKLRPQCGQGAETALAAEDAAEKCGRRGPPSAESNGLVGKWLDELECSWIEAIVG